MKFSVRFLMSMFFLLPSLSWASAVITYHGRILDPDGFPLEKSNVKFRIQILSPNPGNCLLYEETRTIDMTDSRGIFVIPIGDAAPNSARSGGDPGLSMEKIFANNGEKIEGLSCISSDDFYTSSSIDTRSLQVAFDDGGGWDTLPPMTLNHVPFAVSSHDTQNVGGVPASSVLTVQGGSATALSPANFTELLALVNGSSPQFEKSGYLGGVALPTTKESGKVLGWNAGSWEFVAPGGAFTEADPSVKDFAKEDLPDCDGANEFLRTGSDGKFECGTALGGGGSGSVTSVAAGSGLLTDQSGNAAITGSGTLSVNAGTGVGQVLQFTTANTLPVLDGSNLTDVTADGLNTTAAISSGGHTVTGDILVNNGNITATGDGVSTGKILAPLISGTSMSAKDLGVNNIFVRSPADHATNGIYITAPTADVTAAYTLKLPQALPGSSMVLGSDASGQLTWMSPTTGGAAGGDLGDNYPDPTVQKIKGQSVSAVASATGQVLRFDSAVDGGSWVPSSLRLGDLSGASGVMGSAFNVASCGADETLKWSSITDAFTCQAISGLAASTITGFDAAVDVRIAAQAGSTIASLTSGRVPAGQLGTGTADGTTFLRGDGSWATISSEDSSKLPLAGGTMTGDLNMGSQGITNASSIVVAGSVQADEYITTSDRRLKTDIETSQGLDLIKKLRGVKYHRYSNNKTEYGFIAQEVEEVIPEAVVTNSQGIKGVQYQALISPLVEAVKELSLRCEANERVTALEGDIENLQQENAQLKQDFENLKMELVQLKKMIKDSQ